MGVTIVTCIRKTVWPVKGAVVGGYNHSTCTHKTVWSVKGAVVGGCNHSNMYT